MVDIYRVIGIELHGVENNTAIIAARNSSECFSKLEQKAEQLSEKLGRECDLRFLGRQDELPFKTNKVGVLYMSSYGFMPDLHPGKALADDKYPQRVFLVGPYIHNERKDCHALVATQTPGQAVNHVSEMVAKIARTAPVANNFALGGRAAMLDFKADKEGILFMNLPKDYESKTRVIHESYHSWYVPTDISL